VALLYSLTTTLEAGLAAALGVLSARTTQRKLLNDNECHFMLIQVS